MDGECRGRARILMVGPVGRPVKGASARCGGEAYAGVGQLEVPVVGVVSASICRIRSSMAGTFGQAPAARAQRIVCESAAGTEGCLSWSGESRGISRAIPIDRLPC